MAANTPDPQSKGLDPEVPPEGESAGSEAFFDPLEVLWDALLSRQEGRVKRAFESLGEAEKQAVLDHLHRMAEEPDWHPEQRRSAQAALAALKNFPSG